MYTKRKEQMETLEEFCARVGCLLLAPRGKNPDHILQLNEETGLIEETPTEGLVGVKSLIDNEKKMVTVLPKGVECQFAACHQEKCVQGIVPQRNMRGLRHTTMERLGVNPKIASLPLIQLIWMAIVAVFNFR